jgi:nucleoside-diphosphate-sugar epimerase
MNLKNKKVIVTGSAGVIGRELINKLKEKGTIIRCFDIAPKPRMFTEEIDYCQKDLSRLNPIEFINFDPEIIFHLAATFERTEEDINFWRHNYLNNILLSHQVIDAAKECKNLKKFIFASSYLVYSPSLYLFEKPISKPIKLKEDDRINPRNLCGAAKYYTEKELEYLNNFKEYPFTKISARIFRVYGKGSRDVISRWIRTGVKNKPIKVFLRENSFDYIFAADVAEGLLRLAENDDARDIVNLGNGTSRKIEEVIKIIKKYIPLIKIKEIDKRGLYEGSCADISRLKQLTKWQPEITLEQGIKMIIDYEIEQKG